jgi:cell wall-associated NlpC family hydrolase
VIRGWRALGLVIIAVADLLVVTPHAGASSIAQTRAAIVQLSAQLAGQTRTSEITANQYDAARVHLTAVTASIEHLHVKAANMQAAVQSAGAVLRVAIVRAYVLGVPHAQILELLNQTATVNEARTIYEDVAIGNLDDLQRHYATQQTLLRGTLVDVTRQRAEAALQQHAMHVLSDQNLQNERATQATLATVTHALRGQIVTYEVRLGALAAKRRDLSGEQRAIAAASVVGGQGAANVVTAAIETAAAPSPVKMSSNSALGSLVVKFAQSQIGVPYVWGGETPGRGFDCSGLVQWAWSKAGVKIPRTTQTQWPALTHVALSALQPGDLLYYYNLDGDHQVDHLVMYVGSGPWGANTVIAAASAGTTVSFAPLFTSGLIGAARP